eukprot:CAMPEP_0119036640 /NCGR_PEP_ID=MMETSP1177-20130426/4488_1 /TAXON_ID=2985 /ORGANISM="Ochromonas sp, Strain CCMP1899" /LENGTH=265 /DNA_ID=CAMNT_0006996807 /DNA_START=719 /DNA_END=1513 /DNA_ORIENTATION=-
MARLTGPTSDRALVYYSSSGAFSSIKCPPSNSTPAYSSEEHWDPTVVGLPLWRPSQTDLEAEKIELNTFNTARSSSARYLEWGKSDPSYASKVGAHGFNVWEGNPKCSVPGKTPCSGVDASQGCSMKFMTMEAGLYGSSNGKGAAWHPPVGFHLLRGEAISWLYTLALLDAIYMIEKEQELNPLSKLLSNYESKLVQLLPPLPPPKKCEQGMHCTERPICHTNYMPHHPNNMTLSELIVGSTLWDIDTSGITGKVDLVKMGSGEW